MPLSPRATPRSPSFSGIRSPRSQRPATDFIPGTRRTVFARKYESPDVDRRSDKGTVSGKSNKKNVLCANMSRDIHILPFRIFLPPTASFYCEMSFWMLMFFAATLFSSATSLADARIGVSSD